MNDVALRGEWLQNLKEVTKRMNDMRLALRSEIEKQGVKGDWSHITTQIGMFSFTGLTPKQVAIMVKKQSVYMTNDGRISVCGLTNKNVAYVAESIKAATA